MQQQYGLSDAFRRPMTSTLTPEEQEVIYRRLLGESPLDRTTELLGRPPIAEMRSDNTLPQWMTHEDPLTGSRVGDFIPGATDMLAMKDIADLQRMRPQESVMRDGSWRDSFSNAGITAGQGLIGAATALPLLGGITAPVKLGARRLAKGMAQLSSPVRLTHYTDKPLTTIDPSYWASRAGSQYTNKEYSRVAGAGGGMPRAYAYTADTADTPEHMLGRERIDWDQPDLYDTVSDPLGLMKKGKEDAIASTGAEKYPRKPSQGEIANAQEKAIVDAGYVGTVNTKVGQAQIFEPVDLVDPPSRPRSPTHKRVTNTDELGNKTKGQYVGAPVGVDSPADLTRNRKHYYEAMEKGSGGRNWYHDSSDWINEMAGSDPVRRERFQYSIGPTSQGAGVDPNVGWGIKGYNQGLVGDPVNTGRFPNTAGPIIEETFANRPPKLGEKLEPFTENISVGWKPGLVNRPVHDIWDARAWGYQGKDGKAFDQGLSPSQHRFLDKEADYITQKANYNQLGGYNDWDHMRSQAASWTGEQINAGKLNPLDAAKHYGSYQDKYAALSTRESAPGNTTGDLTGFNELPFDVRQDYHNRVGDIFTDNNRDILRDQYGMLGPSGRTIGLGVWEGDINPATGIESLVGRNKQGVQLYGPDGKTQLVDKKGNLREKELSTMDPASERLLKAQESAYGLLTGQDMVAAHLPIYDKTLSAGVSNMADFNLGSFSPDDVVNLENDLRSKFGDSVAVTFGNNGQPRVLFFGQPGAQTEAFQKAVKKIKGYSGSGANSPISVENNWALPGQQYGQNYLDAATNRPGLRSSFDAAAPDLAGKMLELRRQFAKDTSLNASKHIDDMQKALSTGGFAALDKLIKTGAIPAVLVAALLGNEDTSEYN